MNEELAKFAEEVRRASLAIAGAAVAGNADLAGQRALSLCTRAAAVKEGEIMLAGLAVNLGAATPELVDE
jgi:hypothetical protein